MQAAIAAAELTQDEKKATQAKVKERKNDDAAVERPLRKRLHALGYIVSVDGALTVTQIDSFRGNNTAAIWPVVYSKSGNKPAKVAAALACIAVVQRLTLKDGSLEAVECVHCAQRSAHVDCTGCPCGDWHCNVCVPITLEQHKATCARANEPTPTSEYHHPTHRVADRNLTRVQTRHRHAKVPKVVHVMKPEPKFQSDACRQTQTC